MDDVKEQTIAVEMDGNEWESLLDLLNKQAGRLSDAYLMTIRRMAKSPAIDIDELATLEEQGEELYEHLRDSEFESDRFHALLTDTWSAIERVWIKNSKDSDDNVREALADLASEADNILSERFKCSLYIDTIKKQTKGEN